MYINKQSITQFFINLLNPKPMARAKMMTCSISGNKYKANNENFYMNRNSRNGLHPYHKKFDNFRRSTGASVEQVRNLVTLIKQ